MATDIDVDFSFTNDTKNYWKIFDKQKSSRSCPDPDFYSPRLRTCHQKLWSKRLPNGEVLKLEKDGNYLVWKDFHFGSDSIVNMYFHHIKAQKLLTDEIKKTLCQKHGFNDFTSFWKNYLLRSYTIGGAVIFPKKNSINAARGKILKDRFDLTLDCIRLYFLNKESPLFSTLKANKLFFDLFIDFKRYVDFFLLQDLVSADYSEIKYFNRQKSFNDISYPQTLQDWTDLYQNQLDFVKKRNQRIEKSCKKLQAEHLKK